MANFLQRFRRRVHFTTCRSWFLYCHPRRTMASNSQTQATCSWAQYPAIPEADIRGLFDFNFGKNETTENPQGPLSSVPAAQGMLESFQRNSEVREVQLFPDDRNKQLFCVVGRQLKVVASRGLLMGLVSRCVCSHRSLQDRIRQGKNDISLNSRKESKQPSGDHCRRVRN